MYTIIISNVSRQEFSRARLTKPHPRKEPFSFFGRMNYELYYNYPIGYTGNVAQRLMMTDCDSRWQQIFSQLFFNFSITSHHVNVSECVRSDLLLLLLAVALWCLTPSPSMQPVGEIGSTCNKSTNHSSTIVQWNNRKSPYETQNRNI